MDYNRIKEKCKQLHWYNQCDEGYCELLAIKQNGTYSDEEVICSEANCPLMEFIKVMGFINAA